MVRSETVGITRLSGVGSVIAPDAPDESYLSRELARNSLMNFTPSRTFTRLEARITEEEGNFTVSGQMQNSLNENDRAWGVEKADSIEMASGMIGQLAAQFAIPPKSISICIVMNNYRDGTLH